MNKILKFIKKRSNASLFDEWIERYHGALYKHALWMLGSSDLAQEMTQEAFFQAWQAMDSLKERDKALPWLLTILRRCVYREQRCQYRNQETMTTLARLEQESVSNDAYSMLEIYQTLAQLSPKLRDTFLLFHLHGFSYEEISVQMAVPIGTVMSRVSRAREQLQKQHRQASENIVDMMMVKRGTHHDG